MEERSLNSWEDFKTQLAGLRRECKESLEADDSPLLFRGQESSLWSLTTTLDRRTGEPMLFQEYYGLIGKIRPEIESLIGTQWPIPEYPDVLRLLEEYDRFSRALSFGTWPGYAYMAHLRHHGFPSPLLDWTRSPFIAAYFAFAKARPNSQERVSIYALARRRFTIRGTRMSNVLYLGPFVTTDRRHVLQQSQYTLCLAYGDVWRFDSYDRVFSAGPDQQGICWKFTIPATERAEVLKELDEYNLNAFSLFGTEESLMETLATREFSFDSENQDTDQRAAGVA